MQTNSWQSHHRTIHRQALEAIAAALISADLRYCVDAAGFWLNKIQSRNFWKVEAYPAT